jgi:hypothetical protein
MFGSEVIADRFRCKLGRTRVLFHKPLRQCFGLSNDAFQRFAAVPAGGVLDRHKLYRSRPTGRSRPISRLTGHRIVLLGNKRPPSRHVRLEHQDFSPLNPATRLKLVVESRYSSSLNIRSNGLLLKGWRIWMAAKTCPGIFSRSPWRTPVTATSSDEIRASNWENACSQVGASFRSRFMVPAFVPIQ